MNRDEFVRQMIEYLKSNQSVVSGKATAEGAYESLTFAYPQVEKDGISALVDVLSDSLNQDGTIEIRSLLPSFFELNNDFLSGLKYCLTSNNYSAEIQQLLQQIAFLICYQIPYVLIKNGVSNKDICSILQQIDCNQNDGNKLLLMLLQQLKDGHAKSISVSFANRMSFHTSFPLFLSIILSHPIYNSESPLALEWTELLFFLRDFVAANPSEMHYFSPILLSFVQGFVSPLPFTYNDITIDKRWLLAFVHIVAKVIDQLSIDASSTLRSYLIIFIPKFAAHIIPLVNQTLKEARSLFNEDTQRFHQTEEFDQIITYLHLIDYYAEFSTDDPFDFLVRTGYGIVLLEVMNTYPPSTVLSQQARHIVFLLCLRSNKAFSYYSKVSTVVDLLTLSSETSFYSSFWRMLFNRSSLQDEISLIQRMINENCAEYLTVVADLLSWLQQSPITPSIDASLKTVLSSLFLGMKPFLTNVSSDADIEEDTNTSKERNYALERDLVQHCLSGIKNVNVQMMYGRNKCDCPVCYIICYKII